MRLDKFVCHCTGMSRQQVQRMVRAGRLSVNNLMVKKFDYALGTADTVKLDDEKIALPQQRYLMLHKPAGYVCANRDSEHPVVLDLINESRRDTLQIAGRLDIDTTGLVLVTDDGAWNHRITAPSRLCRKTYLVRLSDPMDDAAASKLRAGIMLDGEKKPTLPAELTFIDNQPDCIRLSIYEGKYHQVKRMLAAVGNHVVALHRESIGGIFLDPLLASGEYRTLTAAEVASVEK